MKLVLSIVFLLFFQNNYCLSLKYKSVDSVEIYTSNGEFHKGLYYSKKQITQYIKQRKFDQLPKIIIQEATLYNLLSENDNALKVLFNSLNRYKNRKELFNKIIIQKKIADIYILMKEYKKANSHLHICLKEIKKTKNDSLLARINQGLYRSHMLMNSDSSLFYLGKANHQYKKIGDDLSYYLLYSNNFNYYILKKKDKKLAKKNIDSCVFYAKKSKVKERILLALGNLVYNQVEIEGNWQKGKETYLEIFKINKNDSTSSRMAEHFFSYGNVLQYLGEFKEANKYLRKSIEIKELLYKKNLSNSIRDIETKYQIEKAESHLKKINTKLIKNQVFNKTILIVIFSFFFSSIIFFFLFIQNSRVKQKLKLKLIKNEIQENILNATIDGQEMERKKIASFLHDNISALLSSAGLHLNVYKSKNVLPKEEISKTITLLAEAHDKIRDLSHELLPPLLARFGLFYALQDLCEKVSNSNIHFEYKSDIAMERRYDEEFEMKIYFMVSELMNNIIKHSNSKTAKVIFKESNNRLRIKVFDNGQGFDSRNLNSFKSFGLHQIKARIDNMKGSFSIISKIGIGTIIDFEVSILNQY